MTRPITALDFDVTVTESGVRLQSLLAAPPAGHTPEPQPAAWYETVFDLLACAHPEACNCPEETR